ncbi:MAG: Holliday junction resolvase RuvX [Firmicutes bacterium]|nr:Holliday junction resolvase RuvX [Bacillota bacterium]
MRILGLDYGDKTVGVAVSDPFGWTAQGVEIIRRNSPVEYKQSLGRISELISEYGVEKIVLGFPRNMDGSEGPRCEKTLAYKERLEKRFKPMEVILWDERLSTVAADRYMMSAEMDHFERKSVIDKMAAVFILQGYLDSVRNEAEKEEEEEYDTIVLEDDDGTETEYDITDEAEEDGTVYIFVRASGKKDGAWLILKEVEDEDGDICYEEVEDETELEKAKKIFNKA